MDGSTQAVLPGHLKLRRQMSGIGLGQAGTLVPTQKLILAMWKFIYTVATTRKVPLAIETPKPEELAPTAVAANDSLALARAQSAPALAAGRQASLALPQEEIASVAAEIVEEGSLEAEFAEHALPLRRDALEDLYRRDDSSIYMEADFGSRAIRAIEAAFDAPAITSVANDNRLNVGAAIAGLLPPAGRDPGENGNQGLNAPQGEDDLAIRLRKIADMASRHGNVEAIAEMHNLMNECLQPQAAFTMKNLFKAVESNGDERLQSVLQQACVQKAENSLVASNG